MFQHGLKLQLDIKVYGFCPFDIEQIYLSEGLYTHNHIKGDYTIQIIDGNKTVYITDFAGTQTFNKLPRNSTIVVQNNEIIYHKENIEISSLYYKPPQGLKPRATYDELFQTIDDAVRLRCVDNPWITMSSGHDSGVIVASALSQNLKFSTLSVKAVEDMRVLDQRLKLTEGVLIDECDNTKDAHQVTAESLGAPWRLCKTLLLGLGADEYFDTRDYQLATTFFRESSHYYKSHGIELRYPLLDPHVFFMYHILEPQLKGHDKKPLRKYMQSKNFPYRTKGKISFHF
jgi:asparagine synthetase B (glutamine-hydrolysing)